MKSFYPLFFHEIRVIHAICDIDTEIFIKKVRVILYNGLKFRSGLWIPIEHPADQAHKIDRVSSPSKPGQNLLNFPIVNPEIPTALPIPAIEICKRVQHGHALKQEYAKGEYIGLLEIYLGGELM